MVENVGTKLQWFSLQDKHRRIAIAVAPSNANILYSVIECEKTGKGLYKSEDLEENHGNI
jgi:hypothetical protein